MNHLYQIDGVYGVLDPILFAKMTEYQEQGNSSFEIITVFIAVGSKRHSPNACRATTWITAPVRRGNMNETNELNLNFVLRRKYNLGNQVQILSCCFYMADHAFLKTNRVLQDTPSFVCSDEI